MQLTRILSVVTPALAFVASIVGPVTAPAYAAQHTLEISVTNSGTAPLECIASIAHWFAEELGVVAPGEALQFSFGYDLNSGTIFRRNERGDAMAVQRVWCGAAGNAWPTRADITLERRAGEPPAPVAMICETNGGTTLCKPEAAE